MPLQDDQRRRYARHLLLAEIGEDEQAALCGAQVGVQEGADPTVASVALDYLVRSGAAASSDASSTVVTNATAEEVAVFAGSERLTLAAAAVRGAFDAVECIKAITGVGEPGQFPTNLRLSSEKT